MWSFKNFAVPLVATIIKLRLISFFTIVKINFLLSSSIEIKTLPLEGRMVPHAIWLLAKADKNVLSIPMTSPVDFISGMFSKRSPVIILAAILAIGIPLALATKGTVLLALGLTSST